ncbi:hypothetical protein F442_03035, partial [Phytophthora nicotianae P10297]
LTRRSLRVDVQAELPSLQSRRQPQTGECSFNHRRGSILRWRKISGCQMRIRCKRLRRTRIIHL